MECPIEDVAYGGARGGGKTVALLLDFVQHATKYGKAAHGAIFRKRFSPDLQDVLRKGNILLVDQLKWQYHGTEHRWTSPDGAVLWAHYVENLNDAMNYKGHEWTWLGIDEIGDWADPRPIDFLWACLRSSAGIPCVRRSTMNPGGPGHVWAKKRYDPEHPYIVKRWQPQKDEAPHIWIESVFIPSRLEDNPLLMKNDPGYEGRLALSGTAALYRAWRHGKWDVIAGQFFDVFDPRLHVVRVLPPGSEARKGEVVLEPWHQRWLSMDWGFADDAAVHWHAMDENRRVVTYRELVVNRTEPSKLGQMIVDMTPKHEKINSFYLGKDAYHKRTTARTIAEEIGTVVKQADIPLPAMADDDRIGGWQLMYQTLASGYWLIGDSCKRLIEAIPLLQHDEKEMNDVAESPVDHAPDSARYGLKTHLRRIQVPIAEQVNRALAGQESADPTIAMLQRRIIEGRLTKSKSRLHAKQRRFRRYAA